MSADLQARIKELEAEVERLKKDVSKYSSACRDIYTSMVQMMREEQKRHVEQVTLLSKIFLLDQED